MPLSQKQMEYLALAWQCFDVEPKIDYTKFAQVAGLASANSARELMRVTKNKLKTEYGALSGDVKNSNAKTLEKSGASTSTPKKKGGGSASATASPAPGTGTGKKRARKSVVARVGEGEMEVDGEGEGEGTPRKKSKSPIKREVVEEDDEGGDDGFQ